MEKRIPGVGEYKIARPMPAQPHELPPNLKEKQQENFKRIREFKRQNRLRQDMQEIWGPEPTEAEIAETKLWNSQEEQLRFRQVIGNCVSAYAIAELTDTPRETVREDIENGSLIAINLGELGYWIPVWQFDDYEGAPAYQQNTEIRQIWDTWKEAGPTADAYGFCSWMTLFETCGTDLPVNILSQESVNQTLKEELHGIAARQAQPVY